jgi:hypothetical protein
VRGPGEGVVIIYAAVLVAHHVPTVDDYGHSYLMK